MVTKLTPNQQEWKKEVKRLRQFMRRAEKRGYTFSGDVIPETPARITKKQLSKIKGLNPQTLYSQAQYYDSETGQTLTGTEGRRLERKRAAQKGAETKRKKNSPPHEEDVVLRTIEQMIDQWSPLPHWSTYFTQAKSENRKSLQALLDTNIALMGRKEVARRLQAEAENVITMADEILYSSDEDAVNLDLTHLASLLKGAPLTLEESIYFTEVAENYNEME